MTDVDFRLLRRLALTIALVMPTTLLSFAAYASSTGADVVQSAQRSAVVMMLVLAVCILAPLGIRSSARARERSFVVFWFLASTFFNAVWQIPLILFRGVITTAPPTHENLFKFIAWWGYGFADSNYGRVTGWMIAEELWWLMAIAMSVHGLVKLRAGDEPRALLFLGLAGALETYNASLYIVHDWLAYGFSNIPDDSPISLVLYWGFNPLWATAALIASVFSFRALLRLTGPAS